MARQRTPYPYERKETMLQEAFTLCRERGMTEVEARSVVYAGLQCFKQGTGVGWSESDRILADVYGSDPEEKHDGDPSSYWTSWVLDSQGPVRQ